VKQIALVVAILSASGASASAADLAVHPYTKAPPVEAVVDWSGFFAGANGGGGWSRNCWAANPFTVDLIGVPATVAGPEGCHTASGAAAGGQIGYRWQSAAWVFGLEAQGDWVDLTGSNASQLSPFFTGFADRSRIDAIGLFTGQVGYSWNAFLLYVKGGAAVAHDKYESFLTVPVGPLAAGFIADRGSETRWGGVVGIGGEYSLTRNWSVALEYDHLFMGDRDIAMTYDPAFSSMLNHSERVRQDVDMLTARVNYRFGAPVVARY
jgi:outer membrane immunogenic protein